MIFGGIAQLGEHLPCTQGVGGSNPFASILETRDGKPETRDQEEKRTLKTEYKNKEKKKKNEPSV